MLQITLKNLTPHFIMNARWLLLFMLVNLATVHCQLFTMDQSKILRIYGGILPKKSSPPLTDNATVTEKLLVKHYSNSKINTYLNNIHKNQLFEQNRDEHTPKTILEVNGMLNNNQNNDWAPTDAGFRPHWENSHDSEGASNSQNPGWSVVNDEDDEGYYYSSTTKSPVVHKSTKKRQDSNYYNLEADSYEVASNKKSSDWSTHVDNFVTPPQQDSRPQYSTIYKQHKTKSKQAQSNAEHMYTDWSTPRSMSAYSEWLTTPDTYTTPSSKHDYSFTTKQVTNYVSSSQPTNSWLPHEDSKWVTVKPTAQPLSTSGPDLEEFISRQENRYKNSLYSGVNSYGDLSQDILTRPRDYRQTPNSNTNYNPNILKEQFDIPPNIQSFDPYSEYQDYSTSTARYPHLSTSNNFVSSTTKRSPYDNGFQSTYTPYTPESNNKYNDNSDTNYANNNFNTQNNRPGGFGEPEVVIESKFKNTLKKHFDSTINLYESQTKQNQARPQRNGGKINVEIPNSNIKFEINPTENTPRIVIENNYHLTTEHPDNGYSEVYNRQLVPSASPSPNYQPDSVPQHTQNDLQLPTNYDYTPKKTKYDKPSKGMGATFESHPVPIVEIGGGYGKGSYNYHDGNHTLNAPVSYEIPHLNQIEHKKPHINWCRLKSKRYITDKRCVSFEPVVESVCSDNCVMPPKGRNGHPPPPSKRRKGAPPSWTCVESHIQKKKIKLRCQDKSIRWYNLKVVNGCDCRKKPIKVTKRITIRTS